MTEKYDEFWKWFVKHEQQFYNVVVNNNDIKINFFDKLSEQIDGIKDGIHFLTGMYDANTVELIITPDGNVKNIVFVEELINAAPQLGNWKFIALKPSLQMNDFNVNMGGYVFSSDNLFFYAIEHPNYPDVVDIVVVYNSYHEKDKSLIINGICIFLDNILGELNFVTTIDNLAIVGKQDVASELIPISKLRDYLIWREKEFLEKYSGIRYNTDKDEFVSLQATLENGKPLIAIVNSTLLEWDCKASHPWIVLTEINFDGEKNNGLPDNKTFELLNSFEDDMMLELKNFDGYLYVGHQTADNMREIYFACKDFRKPSKVLDGLIKKYANEFEVNFDIFKDKYWQSFERFRPS